MDETFDNLLKCLYCYFNGDISKEKAAEVIGMIGETEKRCSKDKLGVDDDEND